MKTRQAAALALLLSGCHLIPGTESYQLRHAEKMVAATLADPDAAKFRGTHRVSDDLVCGEVNGKNSFGAYTGFRAYFYRPKADAGGVFPTPDGTNATALAIVDFPKECYRPAAAA